MALPLRSQTATLAGEVELEGVGLHSGRPCRALLAPGHAGTGVVFRVGDVRVPAVLGSVREAVRCTGLGAGDALVGTVEHLLAALWVHGVDDAEIRIEGPEVPALDGSAKPFVEAVKRAGLVANGGPRSFLVLREPVYVEVGAAHGFALPYQFLRVTVGVAFPPPVGVQVVDYGPVHSCFEECIAPARTPGIVSEWDALRAQGLALGASKDNVLPVLEDGYGSPERVPQEVATHKALDLIGDLALLGAPLLAHVVTSRGSHALNHSLARAIGERSTLTACFA